jgi:electron transfer flavoprotein alpha subunit
MILVVLDGYGSETPDRLSAEALTVGRGLAESLGVELRAAAFGPGAGLAAAAGEYGVAALHAIGHPSFNADAYAPEAYGASVAQLVGALSPAAVLATGSDRGTEVLAHAAARTGLPMLANCTDIRPGEPWTVTRQRWGGSLLEEASIEASTRLFTVAPHAVEPASAAAGVAPARVDPFTPELTEKDRRVRVVSRIPAEPGRVSLADARVVVGGGRGVGGPDGFAALEELADLLGGTVGVSRVVTSAGWRPHSMQVGQTGTRIAPDLYIACGISGAIQHIVGCRSAKRLLAINTDPDAPLVTRADYAVIGDLHAILPAIITEVRAATGR